MVSIWLHDPTGHWRTHVARALPREEIDKPPHSLLQQISSENYSRPSTALQGILIIAVGNDEEGVVDETSHQALSIMHFIRRNAVPLEIIGLARNPDSDTAEELKAMGALAVLSRLMIVEDLPKHIKDARERLGFHAQKREHVAVPEPPPAAALLYRSSEMRDLHEALVRLAKSTHDIVIVGETGAGKEQVAREIHRIAVKPRNEGDAKALVDRVTLNRAGRVKKGENPPTATGPADPWPFLEFNCALLAGDPERQKTLLFGVTADIYTGVAPQDGLFTKACLGDLFLDEVECMDKGVQAMLLKSLETRIIQRIGREEHKERYFCRVLLGFKKTPEVLMQKKKLRKDLYFRIAVAQLHIKPLRERKEDIPLLAYHFLLTSRDGAHPDGTRKMSKIAPETMNKLKAYSWPGNVRTLKNAIEFGLITATHGERSLLPRHVQSFMNRVTVESEDLHVKVPARPPAAPESIATRYVSTNNEIPDKIDLKREIARLKVEWFNAAFRKAGSVVKTWQLLGYTNPQTFLRERQQLCSKTYKYKAVGDLLVSPLRVPER